MDTKGKNINKRVWVIGDVHGMYDPLKRIITTIRYCERNYKGQPAKLIFLGDYIDYGPCAKEVIDLLIDLSGEFETVFLAGNHDDLLLQFFRGGPQFQRMNIWFNGSDGQDTVCSLTDSKDAFNKVYQAKADCDFTAEEFSMPEKYHKFFKNLVYSHTEKFERDGKILNFAFTHANLFSGRAESYYTKSEREGKLSVGEQLALKTYEDFHKLSEAKEIWIEDMHIWNRDKPLEKFDDYILIHGHTPTIGLKKCWNDIGKYAPESLLPYFNFKDTPEIRKGECTMEFYQDIDNIISVDIDTGAAMGGALTAIYLCDEDLFNEKKREIYMIQSKTSGLRRARLDKNDFLIYFSEP